MLGGVSFRLRWWKLEMKEKRGGKMCVRRLVNVITSTAAALWKRKKKTIFKSNDGFEQHSNGGFSILTVLMLRKVSNEVTLGLALKWYEALHDRPTCCCTRPKYQADGIWYKRVSTRLRAAMWREGGDIRELFLKTACKWWTTFLK